jgi:hypothetical protein
MLFSQQNAAYAIIRIGKRNDTTTSIRTAQRKVANPEKNVGNSFSLAALGLAAAHPI